jgi:hypothetical protein
MNQKKLSLSIYLLFILFNSIYCQLPDGVSCTNSFLKIILKNYNDENKLNFQPGTIDTSVNISIRVYIVMNSKGFSTITANDVNNDIKLTNIYFNNIGINFFVDSIVYVDDYNYSNITYNHERTELLTKYSIPNEINLYLVDSIKLGNSQSYGFTYFPDIPDSNYIFICKDYFSGNSLSTMLGHFMGLLSTHETLNGVELVNEKNCAIAGDLICDTYADPNLFNLVVDTCQYIGNAKDLNGAYLIPSVANIMSNTMDHCKCTFSTLQYRRMYYYYYKYRQYLH